MDGSNAIRIDQGLRQVLAEPPRSPGAARRGWLDPFLLRVTVAAADSAQVALLGLLVLGTDLLGGALPHDPARLAGLALLAATLVPLVRRALRTSETLRPEPLGESVLRAALAVLAATGAMGVAAACLAATGTLSTDLAPFAAWGFLSAALSVGLRFGAARLAVSLDGAVLRVAVVGSASQAGPLADSIDRAPASSWNLVARLDDGEAGDMEHLRALVRLRQVDVVALAMAPQERRRISAVCDQLVDSPVRLCLGLDGAALGPTRLGPLQKRGGFRLHDLVADPHRDWRGVVKRGCDVAGAAAGLVLLSPVLLAAALAVRLDTPGPVLFRQWRFGAGSQPIPVLKFRTMFADRGDASGEARTLARDPRVTRVGRILRRTSIDELPQLLNVLRGEMSLVGPRPHTLHMKVGGQYYFEAVDLYRARHRVKPGITGWAQINGSRGEVDTIEKARRRVELDLWYIRNWSLMLDFRITLRTALGGFATLRAD